MADTPVTDLPNIGATLAHRLSKLDIFTRTDLEKMGAVDVYKQLCIIEQRCLPICYNLYSLEAALRGHDWRQLDEDEKLKLREQVKS